MEVDLYRRRGGFAGLGDDTTDPSTGDLIAATTAQFSGQDWAILAVGVLILFEILGRGAKSVHGGTVKKVRSVKSGYKKRKKGFKTAVTGRS